jgi:hypothetical protein
MDDKIKYSSVEFAALAKSNPLKWLEVFRNDEQYENELQPGEFEDACGDWVLGCSLEVVESEGGYEGGGESASRVFAIVNSRDDRLGYFKITGFYSSYNGTEWDDEIEVVYPHEVLVTQYTTTP